MKKLIFFLTSLMFLCAVYGQESEITLHTPDGDLYGTLSLPTAPTPVPVVLFVAASGPTDRNGNNPMMKNNAYRMLAEMLAKNGIASLRYDKRGIAASSQAMGKEEDLRIENYVNDAKAWVDLLQSDRRFDRIVIAGHSEGSLIGMMASAGNPAVDKFISLAGPGRPMSEILRQQLSSQPKQILDLCIPILEKLEKGDTVSQVHPFLNALFRPSVQPYLISCFQHHPTDEIAKLKIPVLLIQGSNDLQCGPEDAELLAKACPQAEKHLLPKMTHVLKDCEATDQVTQISKVYNDPNCPVNTEIEKIITDFIKK